MEQQLNKKVKKRKKKREQKVPYVRIAVAL